MTTIQLTLIAFIGYCTVLVEGQASAASGMSLPIPISTKGQAFDLGRLFGGKSGDPMWTLIDRNLPEVQQMIDQTKQSCMAKLQMTGPQRSLIREPRPTPKEKCLVECVLKGIGLMDSVSNRLNLQRVEQLTSKVTEDNKLAIALGCSLAQSCNRSINVPSNKPCEAAHQLNQCIGRHLDRNRVKLHW
ncbi:general odorant-binding protein 28a [Drosophila nasuta]|nr:general odorant-binding protein 28a [Drosophila nasuta]